MEKKRGMQAQAGQWLEAAGIRAVKTMAQTDRITPSTKPQ